MSARIELHSYVGRIERRLRLGALSRGAALVAAVALVATVLLVLVASAFAFSDGSITGSRLALFTILALAILFGLGLPLWRVNRRHAVGRVEALFPAFQQRLVTFTERDDRDQQDRAADPFVELLAAETLDVAAGAQPSVVAPTAMLLASLAIGIVSLGVLVWMITARPGVIGYGANLLWTGSQDSGAPLYDLRVQPGNATLRRNTDQLITAQPVGILSPRVLLYARYHSAAKWEQVEMRARSGGSGYQFVFTGVPEDVEYYVEAGPRQSKHFTIRVVDPPSVKQIKVTLHYPSWTGLKDTVEEHGGDLRALEGTRADLDVVTDKPLTDGLLALDDGQRIQLAGAPAASASAADAGSHHYHGTIQMERDGLYHVATLDQGQQVRLSEDFFIEARKAAAPTVAISRPGNDYRASPIEEVTLGVHAQDDYGLQNLDLHYSVNGGPDRVVHLLKQAGDKQASGSSVLPLEDLKLVPGDVISVYAEAKNANLETRTDMSFIQVDPFEREFSQSQQAGGGGGGGGGGGNQPGEISRREKEMIASTFRQLGDKRTAAKTEAEKQAAKQAAVKQAAEAGKFLSEAQSALRDQSLSLAGRLAARDLTTENQEFSAFQQEMRAAADAMDPATQKLQQQKWQDAITDEQKALQHLLRAEATFRQIEVAFGARGGGGGGGAGRDLASLFDLELDMEKNQYETQQSASTADQRARDINDALKKLDELARRQEDLAQQRNNNSQSFEQRWQQEMLQREAQELQRQVEQLTRQAQNRQGDSQQGQGQQSQGQRSASARGQSGQSGQAGQAGQSGESGQAGGDQSGESGQGQGQTGQAGQSARAGRRGQFGQSDDPTESGRAGQGGQRGQSARAGQRGQFGQPGQAGQGDESGESGAAGRTSDARARATQQAAEQALDRLRQAQDDMRRAAADPQRAAEARRAADRLREASNLLSGLQSQEATSRLGSITREADRLVNEQHDQSDRVKRVKDRANASSGDAQTAQSTERDVQQLATDRQRLADDLTSLEQNMRNAARELDAGQRAASDKLRRALEGADQSDLETHLQRTADWLRTGIDPTGNGTESQIATDLQHLRDQVHQAQQALVAGGQGQQTDQTEAALNSINRLRQQLETLRGQNQGQGQNPGQGQPGADRGDPSRAGQPQNGQPPAGQGYQTQSLSRNGGPGQDGSPNGQDPRAQGAQRGSQGSQQGSQGQGRQQASAGSSGSPGQGSGQASAGSPGSQGAQGASGGQGSQSAQGGGGQGSPNGQGGPGGGGGQRGPGADGPIGQLAPGGGSRDGTVWDNVDVGNNARGSGRAAAAQSTPAIDRQQLIQQGVAELNRLRQQAAGDPEMQRQVQSLITAMEHLDLRRFPGNPAAIEELNQRLLTGIDTLELRLRRDLDDKHPGQIRGTDPASIPAGYEDAVAEYYRRLSGTAAGSATSSSTTSTNTPASRRGSSK